MDGRTVRIIAYCFVFLGMFVTLLALIPSQFAVATKQYAGFKEKVPDSWNGIELQRYNFTGAWTHTVQNGYETVDFSVGGRNLRYQSNVAAFGKSIYLWHRYGVGLLWTESLDWTNREEIEKSVHDWLGMAYLPNSAIDEDFDSYKDMRFTATCLGQGAGSSYFKIIILFSFDITTYPSPTDAWTNNDLDILVGITMDYASSAMDAWYLVGSLLTFNTVEVFGNNAPESVAMNFVLALPFLACIVIPAALFLFEVLDRVLPW